MFVGIEVSKDRLDVHRRPSAETFTVARNGQGLEQLAARSSAVRPELVALEASRNKRLPLWKSPGASAREAGGLEITAAAVAAVGLPLAVVNPAQIGAFARGIGRLAKTDRMPS